MGLRSSVTGVHGRHAAGGTAPEDVNCCQSPAERASCEPAPDARGQQPSCQGTSVVIARGTHTPPTPLARSGSGRESTLAGTGVQRGPEAHRGELEGPARPAALDFAF